MRPGRLASWCALILGSAIVTLTAAQPGVTFIGVGFIPGDALDRSGLAGESICQRDDASVCIDQATAGITYRPQVVLFPPLAPWELPKGLR